MMFILDTTIGLGVWVPFMVGKITALLSVGWFPYYASHISVNHSTPQLNPQRLLELVQFPLQLIRVVTDPIVDSVLLLVSKMLVPPVITCINFAGGIGLHLLSAVLGHDRMDTLGESSFAWVRSRCFHILVWSLITVQYGRITEAAYGFVQRGGGPAVVTHKPSASSYFYRMLEEDATVMAWLEPYLAPLGRNVRTHSVQGKASWIQHTLGDSPEDRVFAVILGYFVVSLLLAVYLNVLTVGSMRSASRALRNAVRQQLLVVKVCSGRSVAFCELTHFHYQVAAFIVIELVLFPLGCGVMLDVCTVCLFPEGSFRSRAAFLMYAPLTAVFYHWVIGTMFMWVNLTDTLNPAYLLADSQVPICGAPLRLPSYYASRSDVVH